MAMPILVPAQNCNDFVPVRGVVIRLDIPADVRIVGPGRVPKHPTDGRLWEALMAATSVREASDIIMLRYEKPASIYTADREKSLEKLSRCPRRPYRKRLCTPVYARNCSGGWWDLAHSQP